MKFLSLQFNLLIVLTIFFSLISLNSFAQENRLQCIIDADTGNEMDDLYAIAMAVLSEKMEVTALSSAHFNNPQLLTDSIWHIYPTDNINTLEISQELNEELLQTMGRSDIPHPRGANRMLGYGWGYYEGAPIPSSPATDLILEKTKALEQDEKLNIICLGALTNVAAAIELAPKIASQLKVYLLGMQYDVENGIWNKNEFNVRNDLNAMDRLLANSELELIVMPASTSSALTFKRSTSVNKLKEINHPLAEMLAQRWEDVHAENSWIMWDLALVQAILSPESAEMEERLAPAENGGRPIQVYISIDDAQMRKMFWQTLSSKLKP